MKRVFSGTELVYNVQGKYQLRVSSEGISYTTANGKKSLALLFKEVGFLFLLRYCDSNISYSVTFRDINQQFLGEIDTDVLERREATIQGHNILETKSILIAFAENKLTSAFPDNIPTLEVMLAFTLKEKAIWLKNGSLVGAKHQIKLSDIRRVKCVGNGALNSLCIYTKEKGGFFDMPDMKIPVNELTLPVLEAVIVQNTGRGIDFSQGNGFDQKTSEYMIVRYMNSTFFQNEDGSVSEDWHKTAYDHIQQYQADIKISE